MGSQPPTTSSKLVKLASPDDGTIFYPSGNIAVAVCRAATGRVINILSDSTDCKVLAAFDERGVGSVNHARGNPWVVVSLKGWSVSDEKGKIQKKGCWPRSTNDPVICHVTENLTVEFHNRQNILARFSCEEVLKEFQCGEDLKRCDTYLDKVTGVLPGGKLEMDIQAIRMRQDDVGSLYVPPGPHHTVTHSPGVGILKTLLATLDKQCELCQVIEDMDTTQRRVKMLLKNEEELPEDFGRPTLTKSQRRFQMLNDGTKVVYTRRRLKLNKVAMKDVVQFTTGPDAPSDTLQVLCILADWNPVCSHLEAKLEEANNTLDLERQDNKSSLSQHIQICRVDASEGWTLQIQYDFRTVPMFLMFYGGKLVFASNAIRTRDEMLARSYECLTKGRKGIFLPEHFSFRGSDNFVLDSITNEMSLLHDMQQSGVVL